MPRLSSVAPPDPVAAVVVALSVAAMAATPLAPGWLLPVPAATIVVGTAAVDVAPFTGHWPRLLGFVDSFPLQHARRGIIRNGVRTATKQPD